ncbi:MAG: tripartite tricarboxylate transporter permease [Candidatus Rokubacteria bacterium]|nr:tripartite tricarboxylate transporter permease [Candidatus Rokubacteria bacterium]
MEALQGLGLGLGVALSPENLLYCFIGVFLGTAVGVLPGLGPAAAIALLLPATFVIPPTASIIMLAGIYYGAMYGGSTTSILLNVPGEAASVVTCIDGYQMARQGRAGAALGISAFGSFIAGSVGIVALAFLGPPLARFALRFGPPEYFALAVLGLTLVSWLGGDSMLKGLIAAAIGLLVGTVGIDPIAGYQRFTFGLLTLSEGVSLVPVAMGLFGLGEVLTNAGEAIRRDVLRTKLAGLLPTREDWRRALGPLGRGSILGFLIGVLPGGGAIIASFASYAVERRLAKHPERFGKGAIEGVAGPEAANNAAASGAFIPLFTLGLPSNTATAMIFAALLLHGLRPGPLLFAQNPELVWGVIASMYVGNVLLLALNLPLIGIFVQMLRVPYPVLAPLIVLFCIVGAYSVNNSVIDVWILVIAGGVGWLFRRLGIDGAPLILALILGPIMENALRQSLIASRGDFSTFVTRPISATLLFAALVLVVMPLARWAQRPEVMATFQHGRRAS